MGLPPGSPCRSRAAARFGPTGIMRLRAPFPAVTMSQADQVLYDEVLDADSRQEWGGRLVDFYMKQYGPDR